MRASSGYQRVRGHTWTLVTAAALATVACGTDNEQGVGPTDVESPSGPHVDVVDESAFDYDEGGKLNVEEEPADLTVPFPDVDIFTISYDSAGGEVTGLIAYPPEGDTDAGVIAMHGMPERAVDMIEPLAFLSCAGATAIAIDAPYARADRMTTPLLFDETDRDEMIQLVVDLRRAVDVLESKGVKRIAYDGVSWSVDGGGVLAGVEPRIDGYAFMVGSPVVDRFIRNGSPIGPLAEQSEQVINDWLDLMATVSAMEFIGTATAPIYFQNNTSDTISTPESAERLHAAAGPDHEVQWYDDSPSANGHDPSLQMIADHIRWQTDLLGLDTDRVDTCLAPLEQ
ncbi:alpha/beta hydrolase family protein [Phytoactinopolyspora endophytica]|uniref:alpha/beta hydrolase family protein n=1 Tax=Phytoactinopolyspora endophytica TaxID=1642495 RepID=UPI00101D1001|nr:hypothetical protein [Phytoactinopolyspora endophytica]